MSVLLVVDDEPAITALFAHIFKASDIQVISAASAEEGLNAIESARPDAIMLDIVLPDGDGLEVFDRIKQLDPHLPVVIMTGGRDSQTAIKAIQQGALDYLVKPLDVTSLNKVVRQAIEVRRLAAETIHIEPEQAPLSGSSMIGCSAPMQEVYKSIGRVASQNISILIRGESGTGKELVARAIFQSGPRKDKPFIAINCAAIPEALLESELFGHEKGAFTGADRKRIGRIEQCDGGTLFLDEIGDMEAPLQSKLLRVLQEKQFERVGGSESLTADVRILAATHRDIETMCQEGKFREDLYYRLNGFTINLPPLRDREDDIELLIEHFRHSANAELQKEIARISPQAIGLLKAYSWPGNVRQLQSVIHQAIVSSAGSVLLPDFLPSLIEAGGATSESISIVPKVNETPDLESAKPDQLSEAISDSKAGSDSEAESGLGASASETLASLIRRHRAHHSPTLYDDVIEEVERQLLAVVLSDCGGNLTEAAKRLGITRTTVRSKVNKLGIGIRKVVD